MLSVSPVNDSIHDRTCNALNAGCIEAAVTSALRAVRGLSGHPQVIEGEHDF